MKKKLTAILLTLCMVLGMLPMSALAVWQSADKKDVALTETENGYTFDMDGTTYYVFGKVTTPKEGDKLDYYCYYDTEPTYIGKLTWVEDQKQPTPVTSVSISGTAKVGETLTATVEPADATVTYQWKAGGTDIAGATGKTYKLTEAEVGKTITVTVTGTDDYEGTQTSDATAAVEPATVVPTEYTITTKAVPTDGGTVTTSPAAKAVKGTEVTVTAKPNEGWKTDSIKYNDTDISDVYKFTMPETNVTVVANFSRITVEVPVDTEETEDGIVATVTDDALDEVLDSIAESGASQVTVGSSETPADTVKLTADQAQKLADAKDAGVETVEVATTAGSVVLPTDGISNSAVEVSLATSTAEDGTKTISLSVKGLKPNTKITVKPAGKALEPGKSYVYVDSEGNKVPVTVNADGSIDLTAGSDGAINLDNIQITEVETFSITVTAAENGTVTTDPADKAAAGVKVTVTANPKTGYKLDKITVTDASGAAVTLASDNTFTMPSSNVTVAATFTKTSTGGGGGGGGGGATSYSVKVASTEHGKVTVRPDSAVKDQKVTITVTPDKGYALDTLTVTDANGNKVTLTKVNDTTYTFLMPGVGVTVEADFAATGEEPAETPKFSDVADKNYTFYADIMWAAEKGYMNGYSNGTFRPNNSTTRQALWMVLARIDGANPSDMSAARAWAMASKISDGTNPEAAMSRQQMVTMLYRYAQLKGYKTSGGTSISAYPDAAGVASYAQDAMSWAVGNGIVTGTSDGRLNPAGTASRAHFAAFLHRFCTTAGIA